MSNITKHSSIKINPNQPQEFLWINSVDSGKFFQWKIIREFSWPTKLSRLLASHLFSLSIEIYLMTNWTSWLPMRLTIPSSTMSTTTRSSLSTSAWSNSTIWRTPSMKSATRRTCSVVACNRSRSWRCRKSSDKSERRRFTRQSSIAARTWWTRSTHSRSEFLLSNAFHR